MTVEVQREDFSSAAEQEQRMQAAFEEYASDVSQYGITAEEMNRTAFELEMAIRQNPLGYAALMQGRAESH